MSKLDKVALVLGIIALLFFATHHAVYGNCKYTIEGKQCDLIKWEKK